jgi:excisionase family DNA binding protein
MAATLLTARQVQNMLDVDASTVYRMAGDGRLPAVRIGRQWRFPADAIESLLVPRSGGSDATATVDHASPAAAGAGGNGNARHATLQVPPALATVLLEVVAPALGVTMVVTDLGGRPITPVVNPAPAIAVRLDEPDFLSACTTEWKSFAEEPHLAPALRPGRLGFLCAHGMVRHGASLVAMVLAGGIAPEDGEATGADDASGLFHLDAERREAVLAALPRTAALLSRLVAERHPSAD